MEKIDRDLLELMATSDFSLSAENLSHLKIRPI